MMGGLIFLATLFDRTVYAPSIPASYTAKQAKAFYERQRMTSCPSSIGLNLGLVSAWLVRLFISFSFERGVRKIMDTSLQGFSNPPQRMRAANGWS